MEVDVLIDKITDCLIDTRTGEEVETEYRVRETPIRPKDYKEWKFNWGITEKNGYHIYELFLKGDDTVQGRISLKIDGGVAFTSKSDLVGYYMEKLNAVEIAPRRMVIFENAAQILLDKYMRK